jgi:mannosidase alpha-like ER degradation enhancer 2
MWIASLPSVHKYLADETRGDLWYGHADMQTGKRTKTTYGALDAFFPGLLAFSGDLERARRLQASSFKMWNLHGIEPEILDYKTMRVVAGSYHLRPEIVESTCYLYHYTGDSAYRQMGEKMFDDFIKYCRSNAGYASLADVISKKQLDEMESFVLAETFKYFYLLFASPETVEFDKVIFNTEAHPLRRTW